MSDSVLNAIQQWFVSQCNGDWEHGNGIQIETLDNPGWCVNIDLADTSVEDVPFLKHEEDYDTKDDWLVCDKDGTVFQGRCGPNRLRDVLSLFLHWTQERDGR